MDDDCCRREENIVKFRERDRELSKNYIQFIEGALAFEPIASFVGVCGRDIG